MNNNRADRIDIRFNGKNKYDLKNNNIKITYENLLETKSKSIIKSKPEYEIRFKIIELLEKIKNR